MANQELCKATAEIRISGYSSIRAALNDAQSLRHATGILASAKVLETKDGLAVQGTAFCLGWCGYTPKPGGIAAIPEGDYCLAKRLKELKFEGKIAVAGDCVRKG